MLQSDTLRQLHKKLSEDFEDTPSFSQFKKYIESEEGLQDIYEKLKEHYEDTPDIEDFKLSVKQEKKEGKVDLKSKTILCYDNGLFFEFCLKLCDYYKEVIYYIPWKSEYPMAAKPFIGTEWNNGKRADGFDGKNFIKVENYFDYVEKCDIAFFPDCYDGDLLELLKRMGVPTFGSGYAEELELERWKAVSILKGAGIDTPDTKKIVGIDKLREHLKTVDNKWIKISKYRGEFETFHHENYLLSERWLDHKDYALGSLKNVIDFLVSEHIECVVEEGVDTYCVNGELPDVMVQGSELKDEAYAVKLTKTKDLSEGNKEVNKRFSKLLQSYGTTGFFSTEVRTTKDNKHYFFDPCMRNGLPANDTFQELFTNLGEIIWEGAHGNLIEPEYDNEYALEVLISSGWVGGNHQTVYFPKKYRDNIKLVNCVKIDGNYQILKTSESMTIGSLITTGNSLEECKKEIEKIAKSIQGYEINVKIDSVDKVIEEFNKI